MALTLSNPVQTYSTLSAFPNTGQRDTVYIATDTNIFYAWNGSAYEAAESGIATEITTANEASDTACFPLFVTASGTQTLQPKNNTSLTFNSSTGALGAASFATSGNITAATGTAGTNIRISANNTDSVDANSHATLRALTTAGGGDPSYFLTISEGTDFSGGLDNSDSDKFKEQFSSAIGSNSTRIVTTAGEQTMPLQPAFLAYNSTTDTNVTGDGTTYTIICDTEVFDQNSDYDNTTGIFTAPVTGRYRFECQIMLADLGVTHTICDNTLVTSNRTVHFNYFNPFAMSIGGFCKAASNSIFVDMDAGDTAYMATQVSSTNKTVDVFGDPAVYTAFSGSLVC